MTTPFNQQPPPSGLDRRARPEQPAAAMPAAPPHVRQPVVVTLPDEIDLANASQVYDALTRARESGTAVVVADATETSFCDCAGLRALISAHREAAAAGTELRVAAATSRKVRRILELSRAGQVLDTYPTLAAALDAPSRGSRHSSAQAATSAAPLTPTGE